MSKPLSPTERLLVRKAAALPPGDPERRQLLDRLKGAATQSWLTRQMTTHLSGLKAELVAVANKYTGPSRSGVQAMAEIEIGRGPRPRAKVSVWLPLDEDSTREEAGELARVLLGDGAEVAEHRLMSNMWVVSRLFDLP